MVSLFNWFPEPPKHEQPKPVVIADVKGLNNAQIIEQIHENFYTEVDRLLSEAKVSHSLESTKSALVEKAKNLKALGFTSTKEVKEAKAEIQRLEKLAQENKKKEELIEAINYFSLKYPNYKFITEESVNKICSKYGLMYGAASKYKGTIPDVNLRHIIEFKIKPGDECYEHVINELSKYTTLEEAQALKKDWGRKYPSASGWGNFTGSYRISTTPAPLEIVAPVKDFDMTRAEAVNSKIQDIPDPVVLKPVIFKNKKHYLIVTAWGDEASDELVVNHKMN